MWDDLGILAVAGSKSRPVADEEIVGAREPAGHEGALTISTLRSGDDLLRLGLGGSIAFRCPGVLFLSRRHGGQPLRRQRTGPLIRCSVLADLRLFLLTADIQRGCRSALLLAVRSLPGREFVDYWIDRGQTEGRGVPKSDRCQVPYHR